MEGEKLGAAFEGELDDKAAMAKGEWIELTKSGKKTPLVLKRYEQARPQPKANHFFQTCSTGLPGEYGVLEETFAPAALNVISDWIVARTKARGK